MARVLIRNIDEAVIKALRERAAVTGTSMEEEARRALAQSVGLDRAAALQRLDQIREAIGRLQGRSVVEDLRRDRRRDLS
ncbi:MAG: FitA-like ribbon-helix-helix domain-containing protein [Stellaceae bacterium]